MTAFMPLKQWRARRLPGPPQGSEAGSSLIVVLLFVSVVGLVLTGLLTEAGASVKYTSSVKKHEERVYAADAGVALGIQQVRQNNDMCPGVGLGAGPVLPQAEVNDRKVSVTCTATSGSTFGASGFAVITTSTGANSLTLSNASQKKVEGPVYVSGGVSWGPGLRLSKGNFYQLKPAGGCPSTPSASNLTVSAPYTYQCVTRDEVQLPPAPAPHWPDPVHNPPAMPVPTDPPYSTSGSCRIFSPGKYTAPPALAKGANYFASGTYYFEFAGVWNVKQSVVYGGQPNSWESRAIVPAPACAQTEAAGSTGGKGVQWIFGSTAAMQIDTQGAVELFARTGEAGSATSRISVVGVPNETAWTGLGYAPNTLPATTPLIDIKDGAQQDLAVHGMIYAPGQSVKLTATNSVLAQALGGIVVFSLEMKSSASAQNMNVSIDVGTPDSRKVLITATTDTAGGSRAGVSTAVVVVGNDASKKVTVESWRTRGPADMF